MILARTDELATRFDLNAFSELRPGASPDAITRLDDEEIETSSLQASSGGEPGKPRPDHDDVNRASHRRAVALGPPTCHLRNGGEGN